MFNKVNELSCRIPDFSPDLIILTETWLNKDINNSIINLPGYSIESRTDRTDTTGGRGGGIIVYVKEGLNILVSDHDDSDFNQYCSFSITTNDDVFNFICFYRSPNSSTINNNLLSEVIRNAKSNIFIIGDLNYPNIDWETSIGDKKSETFLQAVNDKFLTQCVDFSTHIKGNILDVILTDIPNSIHNIEDIGRIGNSDHVMILCDIICDKQINITEQTVPDWKKADIIGAKNFLHSINWNNMLPTNTSDAWDYLKSVIAEINQRFIPEKKRRNPNKPLWLNKEIIRLQRKKSRIWKKYKVTKSHSDLDDYKVCRKHLQKTIRNAKRNLEKKISLDNKNQRSFNSYIKSKTSNRTTVGPLKKTDGVQTSDTGEITVMLNDYFSSIFSDEDISTIPVTRKLTNSFLPNIIFEEASLRKKIMKLKVGSAPGPDSISVKFLQTFCDEISVPLSLIFNLSMGEGLVPSDWRNANVTPIFKKGNKGSAENYRPVSLTSIPCKLMESLIKDEMVLHLEKFNLIHSSQHGFMKHKSVTTNLLEFMETVTAAVDEGDSVDILYLDFQKAFDKVPRERLLTQLEAHGFTDNLLKWIRSWLTDRKQRVVLNGACSNWAEVKSGVPQGSILGPLGFVIYINPLGDDIKSLTILSKFADDSKGAKIIRSLTDNSLMQTAIDKLSEWADKWSMKFNVGKCKIMHLGKNNPKHQYTMNNIPMISSTEEKDVGVLVTDNLKPSKHCAQVAQKANQVLGQMTRAFHFRDRFTFVRLYKQYVRCHLEFASCVWNPWTKADCDVLERVQMRAVSFVSGLKGSTYEEKLKELNLQTLEDRRKRADMIQTFKIVNGFDNVDKSTWFKFVGLREQVTRLNQDGLNLAKPIARLEIRKHFFSHRVIDLWNTLPHDVKHAKNTLQFKQLFDKNH